MSKMGWLHHLVKIAHHSEDEIEELEGHLGELGFKNPTFAAKEFMKAYAELEENVAEAHDTVDKLMNDPDDGSWKGR